MRVLLAVSLLVVLALAGPWKGGISASGRRELGPFKWGDNTSSGGRREMGTPDFGSTQWGTRGRREMGPFGGFGGGFSNLACALARKNKALGDLEKTTKKCSQYFCELGDLEYCVDDKGAPIEQPTTDSDDGDSDPTEFAEMTDAEKEAKMEETGMTEEDFAAIVEAKNAEEENSDSDEDEDTDNDRRNLHKEKWNSPCYGDCHGRRELQHDRHHKWGTGYQNQAGQGRRELDDRHHKWGTGYQGQAGHQGRRELDDRHHKWGTGYQGQAGHQGRRQ